MPNPFHLRTTIDRLWRRSAEHNSSYILVNALDAQHRAAWMSAD